MAKPGLIIKRRLLFLLGSFSILLMLLIVRVGWIQVVKGDWYQKEAFEQQNNGRKISAKRGTIFDRNGNEMAISATVDTITVNPQEIKNNKVDCNAIAARLSEILGMDQKTIYDKINKNTIYETIKSKVDKDIGDKVREWRQADKIIGLYVDEDTKRFYPNRNLASHVIGFTNVDNQGIDGIEAIMEKYLRGVPGKIMSEVDAKGRSLPFKEEKYIEAQDGLNVVLTIDQNIQYFVDNALNKAIVDNKLLGGATAIVMDPRNGEVLALASKPDYDLNNPWAAPLGVDTSGWTGHSDADVKKLQETVWRNKAVVDLYEPGSTFKAITTAAGIEEKAITPNSPVTDATVTVGGKQIDCWKPNAHGNESFRLGVYNSCNPVFVRVAQTLGIQKFYSYVRQFGFYDKTNIGLPGEAKGVFHTKPTELDMAVASFGQRFTITPVELITAYGAIANGGKLMKPILVKELTDSEGNVVKKYEPEVVRNVISKSTCDTVKDILEGVVAEGTGRNAYVKGYRVAGKTGTSQTTTTTTDGRYIASFSAFAPADNPVICVLVVLDHPSAGIYYGGTIAAPVAGAIVEDTLNYLNVERRYTEMDKEIFLNDVYVPNVRSMTIADAEKALKERGLKYISEPANASKNAVVVEQTPKPDATVPEKSVVVLYTYKPVKETMVKMPDISNETISEATRSLNDVGLNIKVKGLGTAIQPAQKPGTEVTKGETITVEFRELDTD